MRHEGKRAGRGGPARRLSHGGGASEQRGGAWAVLRRGLRLGAQPRDELTDELAAPPIARAGAARTVKVTPRQCRSSAPAPPQGMPRGSGQLGTRRKRPAHWAPSHCLVPRTVAPQVVHSCPLLKDLSPEDLASVAGMMKLRAFRADEQLCTVGEPAQFFGVVLSGRLKAAIPHGERWPDRDATAPKLQEWRLLQPGEVIGEMAIFSGLVRTAAVWAISPGWLATVRFAAP